MTQRLAREQEPIGQPTSVTREVLDLGIGSGGPYIRRDASLGIARTGVDVRLDALAKCSRRFGSSRLDLLIANAFVKDGEQLPFPDGRFDEVVCYFPHKLLLYSLISGTSSLWDELGRVLSPYGSVRVIFDADLDNTRMLKGLGRRVTMQDPHVNMQKAAQASKTARFVVKTKTVDPREVEYLGTRFSERIGQQASKGDRIIYELVATKN